MHAALLLNQNGRAVMSRWRLVCTFGMHMHALLAWVHAGAALAVPRWRCQVSAQ